MHHMCIETSSDQVSSPSDLGDGAQAIRDVLELQASAWRQVAWQLARDLRGDVAHGGQHADAAVLDLSLATALEVLHAAISGEAERIEKSDRILPTRAAWVVPTRWAGTSSTIVLFRSR